MMASEPRTTFKLVRNIMNIKKMFRSRRKRKKECYDPDQPSYLLMLIIEPSLFDKVFSYLDHKSIASLERTCTVLRDVVMETRIYRRRFLALTDEVWTGEGLDEETYEQLVQQSCKYKNKLFEHFYRCVIS